MRAEESERDICEERKSEREAICNERRKRQGERKPSWRLREKKEER